MKILIAISFLLSPVVFAKIGSSSVGENCSHNPSENLEDNKYDRLLSYLETESIKSKKEKRRIRGKSTGQR